MDPASNGLLGHKATIEGIRRRQFLYVGTAPQLKPDEHVIMNGSCRFKDAIDVNFADQIFPTGTPRSDGVIGENKAKFLQRLAKGLRKNKFTFWRERRAGRCKAP